MDRLTYVLASLAADNWVLLWSRTEDKEAADQLVRMGLVVLENEEPKRSGDAPVGAWKLKPGVKNLILVSGAEALMSKLGDAVIEQLTFTPLR